MNLKNKQKKHKMKTIAEIITAWAPESDGNPTEAYIKKVARESHITPNQLINLQDSGLLASVMRSMIKMENGFNPISNEILLAAIKKSEVIT